MGPIEKKINDMLRTEGLPNEAKTFLTNLQGDIKTIEKDLVNRSYQQGVYDKELGKPIYWDHYTNKYECYISKMKIGQLN